MFLTVSTRFDFLFTTWLQIVFHFDVVHLTRPFFQINKSNLVCVCIYVYLFRLIIHQCVNYFSLLSMHVLFGTVNCI